MTVWVLVVMLLTQSMLLQYSSPVMLTAMVVIRVEFSQYQLRQCQKLLLDHQAHLQPARFVVCDCKTF